MSEIEEGEGGLKLAVAILYPVAEGDSLAHALLVQEVETFLQGVLRQLFRGLLKENLHLQRHEGQTLEPLGTPPPGEEGVVDHDDFLPVVGRVDRGGSRGETVPKRLIQSGGPSPFRRDLVTDGPLSLRQGFDVEKGEVDLFL